MRLFYETYLAPVIIEIQKNCAHLPATEALLVNFTATIAVLETLSKQHPELSPVVYALEGAARRIAEVYFKQKDYSALQACLHKKIEPQVSKLGPITHNIPVYEQAATLLQLSAGSCIEESLGFPFLNDLLTDKILPAARDVVEMAIGLRVPF